MKKKTYMTSVYLDQDVHDMLAVAKGHGMKLQFLHNEALRFYLSKKRGKPSERK